MSSASPKFPLNSTPIKTSSIFFKKSSSKANKETNTWKTHNFSHHLPPIKAPSINYWNQISKKKSSIFSTQTRIKAIQNKRNLPHLILIIWLISKKSSKSFKTLASNTLNFVIALGSILKWSRLLQKLGNFSIMTLTIGSSMFLSWLIWNFKSLNWLKNICKNLNL